MQVSFEELCAMAGGNKHLGILSDYTPEALMELPHGEIGKIIAEREAGDAWPFYNLTKAAKAEKTSIPKIKNDYDATWAQHGGRTIIFMPSLKKIQQEVAA